MNAANDSVRVIGIGRVRDDPKALELNFTGKPSDDDMRRIHDLLRDGPHVGDDDALWAMLVKQAHQKLGIGPDPGESPFDYLQRALQRVVPYGVPGIGAARPLSEWHEDDGHVVWWKFPVDEPAWIGTPNCDDWPGYHTHWTPHPAIPTGVLVTDQRQVREDSQGLGEPGRLSPSAGADSSAPAGRKRLCRDCADFAQDGICPNDGKPCSTGGVTVAPDKTVSPSGTDGAATP